MTRAQLNSIIEQVVGQITAANFDFLTGKPEYLNPETANNRLAFPVAFMTYPTASLNPYFNQVVGPLTKRYTVQIDFLQLVEVDAQNDAGAMRTVTETMGEAADEFLARMSELPKTVGRIDINSVRDVVVNPHPASDNVLVGVSITFDTLTADTFDYCELTPGGDIVLPAIGPQYVYFAGVIEINNDTISNAVLQPGALNISGISDVSGGEDILEFTVNASNIIAFTVSESLPFASDPNGWIQWRIMADKAANVGSISFALLERDAGTGQILSRDRVPVLNYPAGLPGSEIAYLYIQGIALK